MFSKISASIVALMIAVLILVLPKSSKAEIATGLDWIGLYPLITDAQLTTYENTNISSYTTQAQMQTYWPYYANLAWVYTSSCGGDGSQVLTNPLLAGTCVSNSYNNASPGFMSSIHGAFFYLFFPNNSLYAADVSQYFWRPFAMYANPTCDLNGNAVNQLSWDTLQGVDHVDIYRDGSNKINSSPVAANGSYSDIGISTNSVHTYQIYAYSVDDTATSPCISNNAPPGTDCGGSALQVTALACQHPFLQTSGGDVHSNSSINVQGGPAASP